MECTVRDYATQNGVSDSIIYRHIRNHRQELDGLVIKRGRQTWITDAGQDFLRQLMTQRPLVLADGSSRDELNRLKAEVGSPERRPAGRPGGHHRPPGAIGRGRTSQSRPDSL